MACDNNWLHTRRVLDELIARGRALEEDERRRRTAASTNKEIPCAPEVANPDPGVWRSVKLNELESGLREIGAGGWSAPPIFRLAEVGARPGISRSVRFLQDFALDLRPRDDSGIFEINAGPHTSERAFGAMADYMYGLTEGLDQRDFKSLPTESQFVQADYRSLLQNGIPVIGPGGRVTLYRGGRLSADIVVRQRTETIESAWLEPALIYSRLIDRISREPGELVSDNVWMSFGYFELSKYERQHVMRPAFAFMFTMAGDVYVTPQGEERSVQWQVGYAHAATEAAGLSSYDGMGQWVSIEGRRT